MNLNNYDLEEATKSVDRPIFAYEDQIERLHKLASILSEKVNHISNLNESSNDQINPSKYSTRLNQQIENVIDHFESVINAIQN